MDQSLQHSCSKTAGKIAVGLALLSAAPLALAAGGDNSLGSLAQNLTGSFKQIGQLMIGVAYLAGIGFGIAAIFKFKQHKDNPTQIPVGTPFALLAISVLLVFLPGLYQPAGKSIFGSGTLTAGGFTGSGAASIGTA